MTSAFQVIQAQSGGTPPSELAVFGERNSGTNLAHALLQQNIPAFADAPGDRIGRFGFRYGWKHGFPQMLSAPPFALAVCLFRHPETWLRSMHARPWHAVPELTQLPFRQFISSEWQTRVDERNFGLEGNDPRALTELHWDRHPLTGRRFENILQLRNAKTAAFLSLPVRFEHCILLRHEDVAERPEAFVEFVSQTFGLPRHTTFNPVTHRRGRAAEGRFNPAQYPPLTPQERQFVWDQLDSAQETQLGYAPASA